MTDEVTEGDKTDVDPQLQRSLQLAQLQEQAEADQAELKRLRERVVTLRHATNDLAEQLAAANKQLAAKNSSTQRKSKRKGK
jgi:hypothetical protein